MFNIITSNNVEFIFDREDYEIYKDCNVFSVVNSKYAMIKIDNDLKYLHRLIMKADKHEIVDHINRNTKDNRKCNLRKVSKSQNKMNQTKSNYKNKTSNYKGVCYDKRYDRWICRVFKNNKVVFHGKFQNEISSAIAYNYYSKLYHGEFSVQNSISEDEYIENWRDFQYKRKKEIK